MANKEHKVVIFLDLEKAYDRVWRQGIVYELYNQGFTCKILKWIYAFMSNIMNHVRVGNYISEQQKCNIGIPKGSVISPLICNFMINDLRQIQDTVEISLYADDINYVFGFCTEI